METIKVLRKRVVSNHRHSIHWLTELSNPSDQYLNFIYRPLN